MAERKKPRPKAVETMARLLAWSELTDHGRATCDWQRDFDPRERAQYRKRARYITSLITPAPARRRK